MGCLPRTFHHSIGISAEPDQHALYRSERSDEDCADGQPTNQWIRMECHGTGDLKVAGCRRLRLPGCVCDERNYGRAGGRKGCAGASPHRFSVESVQGSAVPIRRARFDPRRSKSFATIDNTVTLPGYFRADAALYWDLTENMRVQANLENIFDRLYYTNADSNTNITPGSPRAVRIGLTTRF